MPNAFHSLHTAHPATDLALGLGHHYRLERPLGRTTCGEVWHARWLETGEPVVIKRLTPPDPAWPADGDAAQQWQAQRLALARELAHLRQLRHAGIVQCVRATEHQGQPVLVMEAMHASLAQHLAELAQAQALPGEAQAGLGRVPLDVALRWKRQVAEGLRALHAAGLRHLDLKPANLLMTAPGALHQRLKLADFGACMSDDVAQHPFVGTPGWAAPQQLCPVGQDEHGQWLFATDASADEFTLELMFQRWVTGRLAPYSQAVSACYRAEGLEGVVRAAQCGAFEALARAVAV